MQFYFSLLMSSCKNEDALISEIYIGDLLLSTQDKVDTFTFKTVVGSLTISSTNNITNLEGLNSLISVDGSLDIRGNRSLTYLSGLENLTAVGENFDIY